MYWKMEQAEIQSLLYVSQGILFKPVQKELCLAFSLKIWMEGYLKSPPVEAFQSVQVER